MQVGTFDDGMTGAIDIGDKEVTFLTVDIRKPGPVMYIV